MVFNIVMFCFNLLIPLVMLIGGWCMYKHTPKKINALIGYRSTMSMKNNDTWRFAHAYCGKLWLRIGLVLLVISAAVQIPYLSADKDTFGYVTLILTGIQLAALLISIVPVEKAPRRVFNKDGSRRADAGDK